MLTTVQSVLKHICLPTENCSTGEGGVDKDRERKMKGELLRAGEGAVFFSFFFLPSLKKHTHSHKRVALLPDYLFKELRSLSHSDIYLTRHLEFFFKYMFFFSFSSSGLCFWEGAG